MFKLLLIILPCRKGSLKWAKDQCINLLCTHLKIHNILKTIATHKLCLNEVDLRWVLRNRKSAPLHWVPYSQRLSVATVRSWGVKRGSRSIKGAILWETARRSLVLLFSSDRKSLRTWVLAKNAKGARLVGWVRSSNLLTMWNSRMKIFHLNPRTNSTNLISNSMKEWKKYHIMKKYLKKKKRVRTRDKKSKRSRPWIKAGTNDVCLLI